jgi:hypothetical protein
MLRFFRQIRQRLLTDNKFSKYLLYAIGEILLVVIGILIALQVDSWNEERKFKSSQRDFLEDLRTQVINDTTVRSSDKGWFSLLNNQTKRALYLLKNREFLEDSLEYQTVSEALGNAPILMPRTTSIVYSESTMDKIDPELNTEIIAYIQQINHSYNVFQKLSESLQSMSENRIIPNVDFNSSASTLTSRMVHYEFQAIKKNRELINVLHSSVIYRSGLIRDVESQIDHAHEIIVFIDSLLSRSTGKSM